MSNSESYIASRPIGVFDSGVGGLTVVKQIITALPGESIVYLGDSKRAPYGDRSAEDLTKFSKEIVGYLMKYEIKALVVACGTISARIFDIVTQLTPLPVVEMIAPGVKAALAATQTRRIGVIATSGSIESDAHKTAISAQDYDASVFGIACPLFVPLAEEGWQSTQAADLVAKVYLKNFEKYDIDTLLLGCTHYPLLESSIKKAIGEGVLIIDPAVELAHDLKRILVLNNILNAKQTTPIYKFFATGNKKKFDQMIKAVLGCCFHAEIAAL